MGSTQHRALGNMPLDEKLSRWYVDEEILDLDDPPFLQSVQ
jgi:hypothetical protein